MRCCVGLAIVSLGFLTLSPLPLFAQGGSLHLGAQMGVTLAEASYESEFLSGGDNRVRPGIVGGAIVDIYLPGQQIFSVETGLLFEMKGGKREFGVIGTDAEGHSLGIVGYDRFTWKLNYLTVPLCAKVSLRTGALKPYLKAGPELGILLSSKIEERFEGSRPGVPSLPATEADVKDRSASTDFGLLFGAGVEFKIGRQAVFAELSYSHGLTNVFKSEETFIKKLENRVVSLSGGVKF